MPAVCRRTGPVCEARHRARRIVMLHHGTTCHTWRRQRAEKSDRRSAHVFDAHMKRHGTPCRNGHHIRRIIAKALRRQQNFGALAVAWHGRIREDIAHDIVHRVQVVENDRRLSIPLCELRRDGRRHRHLIRQRPRRIVEHLPESRDGRTHTGLPLLRCRPHHQGFVQSDLQPVISPDQAVELRIVFAEREGVRLLLHQLHAFRLRAEREVGARAVVRDKSRHLAILGRLIEPLIAQHVVDLAVQNV